MDTITFLGKVLPPEGVYVSAQLTPRGMVHRFFDDIEGLAQAVQTASQQGGNMYYAVSSMQDNSERTQRNTYKTQTLFIDVDCGGDKPYATWKDGLLALSQFISQLGLPKPMIVHSGNGLHAYWVLTEALAPAQWGPLGLAIKAAAKDKGFAIDMSVPGDSARLLRPVGTVNPKGGGQVKLLIDAAPVDPDDMRSALSGYVTSAITSAVPNVSSPFGGSTRTSTLSQALATDSEFPDANPDAVSTKCQQIQWGVENQAEVTEPFWYAMLGIAAYCTDSEGTAVAWSNKHPDYEYSRTIRKMEHWKQSVTGPATCKKFAEERPNGCKGCKFFNKITTPTQIGAQFSTVEISEQAPDKIGAAVPLPRSFKRTSSGIKQTIDGTDIDICPFDIYPVGYGRDEALGYETVRYHWDRKHMGWQELSLRQAYLTDTRLREFTTAIADQGIVLKTEKQTASFQFMLRSYMDKLREMRAMTNLYNSMGWKDDFKQFVHGNTLYRRLDDGTVSKELITLSSSSQRLGGELYGTSGTEQGWIDFTSLLQAARMPAQMFAIGFSLATPLIELTGLNGLTLSLCGPTGTGKTLGQYWQQSVWGDPQKLHFAAKFTMNSLYNRLGFYCNLPMTIDEATVVTDKEIGDFLYMVTQGRDKARLNRTAEERETKRWATSVTISTNIPWSTKLAAMNNATDAQLMRLLEVTVDPHPLFANGTTSGRKIYQHINSNYGWVGPKFIEHLLIMGPVAAKAMIDEAINTFPARYNAQFSGEERYWEIAIVLTDLALRIANEQGWIKFDPAMAINWVLHQTGNIRQSMSANKMDSFDILSEYLNDSTRLALTVMHSPDRQPVPLVARMPQGEIRVRYDVRRNQPTGIFDHGTVTIDRTHLRNWLAARNADYRQIARDFEAENIMVPVKNNKAYLGKNTDIKTGQSYVVQINLCHPRLRGILDEADQAHDAQMLGELRVV
jgi:hypothetical protein